MVRSVTSEICLEKYHSKEKSVTLLILLVFSSLILLTLPLSFAQSTTSSTTTSTTSSSTTQTQTFSVIHQSYSSVYLVENVSSSVVSFSLALFEVSSSYSNNSAYSNSALPGSNAIISVPVQSQSYLLGILTGQTVSGTVSADFSGNKITVSSPAQLIRVILIQGGLAQNVWAGFSNITSTVSGFGYIDQRLGGTLILQYADGVTVKNYSIAFSPGQTTFATSISGITKMNSTSFTSSSTTTTDNLQFPMKYFPAQSQPGLNSTLGQASSLNVTTSVSISRSTYSPTTAYYNGAILPAIRWDLDGTASATIPASSVLPSISFLLPFNATDFGIYGANGARVGYNRILYGTGAISLNTTITSLTVNLKGNLLFSSNELVVSNGAVNMSGPPSGGIINLNNTPVGLYIYPNGQVGSTADLTFYHALSMNATAGALVWARVNSTTDLVAVFSNNDVGIVNTAIPSSVANATYALSGSTYEAQKVSVNYTGYALFNVTLNEQNTSGITVYKQTSSGDVKLGSTNYFVSGNILTIFDDPANTYFVVYPTLAPSGSFFTSTLGILAIAVIVVVVVVGLVLVLRRRKGSGIASSVPASTTAPPATQP